MFFLFRCFILCNSNNTISCPYNRAIQIRKTRETSKHHVIEHEMELNRSPSHSLRTKGNKRITSSLIKYAFCFYLHVDSLKLLITCQSNPIPLQLQETVCFFPVKGNFKVDFLFPSRGIYFSREASRAYFHFAGTKIKNKKNISTFQNPQL